MRGEVAPAPRPVAADFCVVSPPDRGQQSRVPPVTVKGFDPQNRVLSVSKVRTGNSRFSTAATRVGSVTG